MSQVQAQSQSQSLAIVRVQTPQERAYTLSLLQIEARRRQIAMLQAELDPLMHALERFEVQYRARVGALAAEVQRVRIAIDEYEHQIARAHASRDTDPDNVERDLGAAFGSYWGEGRREAEARFHRQGAFHTTNPAPPRLDAESETEARRLYRELAKRYHPDLARSDPDRQQRQSVMLRINAAFRDRDLPALRALCQEAEAGDPSFSARSLKERIVWAIREATRLDSIIADLAAKLHTLRASDTYPLWTHPELGEAVIAKQEAAMRSELAQEQRRLNELIASHNQILTLQR